MVAKILHRFRRAICEEFLLIIVNSIDLYFYLTMEIVILNITYVIGYNTDDNVSYNAPNTIVLDEHEGDREYHLIQKHYLLFNN